MLSHPLAPLPVLPTAKQGEGEVKRAQFLLLLLCDYFVVNVLYENKYNAYEETLW